MEILYFTPMLVMLVISMFDAARIPIAGSTSHLSHVHGCSTL
jgi:hypothetical protein